MLGDAGFADHPRFRTNPLRMQNRDDLEAHIEQHFAAMTGDEVLRLLDEASIANAHLNSVEAFLKHEQLHARGRVQSVGSPNGPVMSFLPALTLPGVSPRMDPVPDVGEHNEAILRELGLTGEN